MQIILHIRRRLSRGYAEFSACEEDLVAGWVGCGEWGFWRWDFTHFSANMGELPRGAYPSGVPMGNRGLSARTAHMATRILPSSGLLAGLLLLSIMPTARESALAQERTGPPRPNFIIIFTDDQGYGDLGCFGGKHVRTPTIDRLAAEGAKLTNFYVAAPLCTPSRAALMTGCYPKRIGMAAGSHHAVLLAGDTKGLNPDEMTIAEVLKTAGYATGIFGKWHLGDQPEFLPTRQGFDEFFGMPYSWDIHPSHPNQGGFHFPPLPLLEGEKVIELDPDLDYLTNRITQRAVRFIDSNKDRPFFLYLPHFLPHRPLHISPPFMQSVAGDLKAALRQETPALDLPARDKLFPQAISEIDWSVEQIVQSLKKHKLDRNTLIIFTSDNGPAIGSAGPLRGRKGSTFEGGMREPAIAWWPGRIPAGTVRGELLTSLDVLPTFAKLAGAKLPADRIIDGKDIWPVLSAEPGAKSPHDRFFYHAGDTLRAVRSGPWKLHLGVDSGKGKRSSSPALYNLDEDIGEAHNVASDHPEIVQRLSGYAAAFNADLAARSRPAGFVEKPKPLTLLSK